MGIGLTDKELATIRTHVNELLPDTGFIIKQSFTSDGAGGNSVSTAVVAGGTVSYRLDPKIISMLKGGESMAAGAIQPFHTFILTLEYNAPITTENQFLDDTGTLYNVISIDPQKSWNASTRVILEQT